MTWKDGYNVKQGKMKVFIVDDDASICRALKCLLMTFGFTVETFLSGKLFFSAVASADPGCLILDLNMPGLDGWEVQQRLARSGSKRQCIIITADKEDGLRERAIKAGAVGFLQKPFYDRELVELIDQAFNKGGNGMNRNLSVILAALFLATSLLGCNTKRGVGKDVESGGKGIQEVVGHND